MKRFQSISDFPIPFFSKKKQFIGNIGVTVVLFFELYHYFFILVALMLMVCTKSISDSFSKLNFFHGILYQNYLQYDSQTSFVLITELTFLVYALAFFQKIMEQESKVARRFEYGEEDYSCMIAQLHNSYTPDKLDTVFRELGLCCTQIITSRFLVEFYDREVDEEGKLGHPCMRVKEESFNLAHNCALVSFNTKRERDEFVERYSVSILEEIPFISPKNRVRAENPSKLD